MEESRLRKEMEKLWKDTFGDSDEYINLIFDAYFDPERVMYHEAEGYVDAALLSVPYAFKTSSGKTLNGLYLCGLATRKASRRKGIMTTLLNGINIKAEKEGFDFCFLIPANDGMRQYYKDRGFHDAFYKFNEHYVKGHTFGAKDLPDIRPYENRDLTTTVDFLLQNENLKITRENEYTLRHTQKDWEAVFREAQISQTKIYLSFFKGKLEAAAFLKVEEEKEIVIKKVVKIDGDAEIRILAGLVKLFPQKNITLIKDLGEELESTRIQLWNPFYVQNNTKEAEYEDIAETEQIYNPGRGAYSYGMIRILKLNEFISKISEKDKTALDKFSEEEKIRLILRRPVGKDSDNLEKILDLPEISLNMSLMLD